MHPCADGQQASSFNEPNFALDPSTTCIPMRARMPTFTQRQTFSEHLVKNIKRFLITFLLFRFLCVCVFLKQLGMIS